jgi:hypothetical protein
VSVRIEEEKCQKINNKPGVREEKKRGEAVGSREEKREKKKGKKVGEFGSENPADWRW